MKKHINNYKVYMHTSPSGKVYIGITCQELSKRFMNGRGYKQCPRIAGAIKKYGWDNFRHEVLFENLTKEEAEEKEVELIRQYKSNDCNYGYNIENGGNTTGTHSEETKKKISEGNKGKTFSKKSILKMSKAHKGKQIGEENPFYNHKHTEECKKKHSDFMKGNSYFKGKHHSEEFKKMKSTQMHKRYKDNKHPRCKKVIHYDELGNVVKIYASLSEVAKEYNHSKATIFKWVHNTDNKEWSYEQRT